MPRKSKMIHRGLGGMDHKMRENIVSTLSNLGVNITEWRSSKIKTAYLLAQKVIKTDLTEEEICISARTTPKIMRRWGTEPEFNRAVITLSFNVLGQAIPSLVGALLDTALSHDKQSVAAAKTLLEMAKLYQPGEAVKEKKTLESAVSEIEARGGPAGSSQMLMAMTIEAEDVDAPEPESDSGREP